MSSGHDHADGPEFGHIFEVYDEDGTGASGGELRDKIKSGEIEDLKDLEDEGGSIAAIAGDAYKTVKVSADSQGMPYTFILVAADKFDEDWDWDVAKTEEKMFVTPNSNLHNEFMQRRQQAEQNVRQAMQGLEQLRKQKHMLQHDIRKLRSKVEDLRTGEESTIKGDFIELVDGAGQSPRQGGDSMSLKAYRDQNIYPSIVADFNEMDSTDDLLSADKKKEKYGDDEDYEDGPLADLPENEKAILKKKYTMYEKWKDLYGSEIQTKLDDLKKELHRVEKAEEEQKNQVAPYVRDMVMINQKSQDEMAGDINRYFQFEGYSTQFKSLEFIAYKSVAKHHGEIEETDDEDHATHYKVIYMNGVHINISGGENPNSPAEGPTAGKIFWRPILVDKFIFENFFQEKIDRMENQFEHLMEEYTGEYDNKSGDEFREAREEAGLSIRELREKVGEKIDKNPPLEFSSTIRRIEDGFEEPEHIAEEYNSEYLEAVNDLMETSYGQGSDEEKGERFEKLRKDIKLFTGQEDDFYIPDGKVGDIHGDMLHRMKFSYYFDLKLGLGLNTMK